MISGPRQLFVGKLGTTPVAEKQGEVQFGVGQFPVSENCLSWFGSVDILKTSKINLDATNVQASVPVSNGVHIPGA